MLVASSPCPVPVSRALGAVAMNAARTEISLTDEQRRDAELGMAWWNNLPEYSRAAWLQKAKSAMPAAAYAAYKVTRDYALLYRAFVEPRDWRGTELTIFVEACSRAHALDKIARAIAVLEGREVDSDLRDRIYNLSDIQELVGEHLSEDIELRIFETSSGPDGNCYAREPIFLVAKPDALWRLWAKTQRTDRQS
jgi:hypothetical protein